MSFQKVLVRAGIALGVVLSAVLLLFFIAPQGEAVTVSNQQYSINVSATSGWQGAILIPAGFRYSISAPQSGQYWTVDYRSLGKTAAFGYPEGQVWGGNPSCKYAQGDPYAMLLVKFNGDVQRYDDFDGLSSSFDRVVSFRINDANNCLEDNAGALPVTVTVTPAG
ncbi:MAG: hypothetical protein ACR2LN_06955 [Candidatus Levyibacteriota bacterium]